MQYLYISLEVLYSITIFTNFSHCSKFSCKRWTNIFVNKFSDSQNSCLDIIHDTGTSFWRTSRHVPTQEFRHFRLYRISQYLSSKHERHLEVLLEIFYIIPVSTFLAEQLSRSERATNCSETAFGGVSLYTETTFEHSTAMPILKSEIRNILRICINAIR